MIRSVTYNLFNSIMLDMWPRESAVVDFGLADYEHYQALYFPIRRGEISMEALDAALGNGKAITKLVSGCPSNSHVGIVFNIVYDDMTVESEVKK